MRYIVQPGDSLWRIAQHRYGAGREWSRIAAANALRTPDVLLVGQSLLLPDGPTDQSPRSDDIAPHVDVDRPSVVPAVGFTFVLAEEPNPLRGRAVRRLVVRPAQAAELAQRLGRPVRAWPDPSRMGFTATGPGHPPDVASHIGGRKPSPFTSASLHPLGARRFHGDPFFVDLGKAAASGVEIRYPADIVAELDRLVLRAASPIDVQKLRWLQRTVEHDAEVLFRGPVPAAAVRSARTELLLRGLQGVQLMGFAVTAVQLSHATQRSMTVGSLRPLSAEVVRQAGGWAGAWAGLQLGGATGALFGISTGPGALVTASLGSLIGGVTGYLGFDWMADHLDQH
ncbi:MAG: LysM peptidoglycan-binding domain-containing protein [Gemmatimonadaceae bacterium]|jgi:hypothetical protein|nr:LysM peptidoglycan-binding domain-containing protein [Gemmatimonadaceae bacterium]